jgi:putative ABC transport system permease protein
MRSLLTSLGVIIGVAALIVTVASGEGSKAVLAEQLATLGTNLLIILPGSSTAGGARGGAGTGRPLTHDDLLAIIKSAPAVRYAAPVDRTNVQIITDNQNWLTSAYGSTPDYFPIRDWRIAKGRFFNQSESDQGAKVCVLGNTVANNLFGSADPIGESIRVRQMPCTVVGVLASKGQSSQGQDQDDLLVMPWVTFKSRMLSQDRVHVGQIMVSANTPEDVSHAQTQVQGILRQQHKLSEQEIDDFTVRNLADLAETQQAAVETQTNMLRNVAGVSLLVGGIGIMNIMLVSVTERTREIGIRLAIGASEEKVLFQFLVEAVVLSAAGGLVGIALGVGGSIALASFMKWPVVFTPFWIAVAFGISMGIGVVFGFYPARKAARLDPIDALRFE